MDYTLKQFFDEWSPFPEYAGVIGLAEDKLPVLIDFSEEPRFLAYTGTDRRYLSTGLAAFVMMTAVSNQSYRFHILTENHQVFLDYFSFNGVQDAVVPNAMFEDIGAYAEARKAATGSDLFIVDGIDAYLERKDETLYYLAELFSGQDLYPLVAVSYEHQPSGLVVPDGTLLSHVEKNRFSYIENGAALNFFIPNQF
ncbi:MAG: hypothetical protein NDI94_04380 [Candidatus Woesearchaeota archaeon]|nr:hypothetical protein [Candidatus Woesearchaeota archaeon]